MEQILPSFFVPQSDVMKCNIVYTDLFVKHYCITEARKFVCVEFDFL